MIKSKVLLSQIHDVVDNIPTVYEQPGFEYFGAWNGVAFMLDCIIWIKCMVYWGWYYPNKNKEHGGATYIKAYDWNEIDLLNHCSNVRYTGFLSAKPCSLIYMPGHCGFKIDEFTKDGHTYNVAECCVAASWGYPMKCIYSYVDNYGYRYQWKGGKQAGQWTAYGELYGVDYSETTKHLNAQELADAIISGYLDGEVIGTGEDRKAFLRSKGYTDAEIRAAQDIVNERLNPKKLNAEQLAEAIIKGELNGEKIGNGAERIAFLKSKGYTEAEIRAAQDLVNAYYEQKSDKLTPYELAVAIYRGYLDGEKIGNGTDRKYFLLKKGYTEDEIKQAQDIVNAWYEKAGKPLTKAECDAMWDMMAVPTKEEVQKACAYLGMDNSEYIALLGWVQGEGYWGVGDPYLAYLSACVMINNITDGKYGRGRKVLERIASWGNYYSIQKQKDRAANPSAGALKATYLGLVYPQKNIYSCYGPGYKPSNVFYDPNFKVGGENIYVF